MRNARRSGGRGGFRAAGLVVLAVLLAACAAAGPAPAGRASAPVTTTARQPRRGPVTRAQARALAEGMLARLARLPGARPYPVAALPEAPGQVGDPVSPASAIVNGAFRSAEPMPRLFAYLVAHPPAGMRQDPGTGYGVWAGLAVQDVSFELRATPPGVASTLLDVTVAAKPGGGSLVVAGAEVFVYPLRTAAEHVNPAAWPVATIRLEAQHSATRVIRSAAVIARLAGLLNRLPTQAGQTLSCPAISTVYVLAFARSAAGPPGLTFTTNLCWVVVPSAAGRAQPPLADPHLTLYRALSQLLPGGQLAM
jgi:hypothetical protein